YGERDRLFTPRVLRAARLRFVPRIGPGTNRLSCVYAGNVASAAVAALDAPLQGFRAYNVTSDGPPALSQREFFAAFAAALGRRAPRCPSPRATTRTPTSASAASWGGARRPRPERRLGARSPGFSKTKSPGTSPGHRHCPAVLAYARFFFFAGAAGLAGAIF